MKRAFATLGVDGNTISRTAQVAELKIADPTTFQTIPEWDPDEEKMVDFTHRCREAISGDVEEKIKTLKKKGQLLAITYSNA